MSLLDRIEGWILTWMPILLMSALVFLIWRVIRAMPRTKPKEVGPESGSSVRWEDVAGCEEAKDELREVVEFMRNSKYFKRLGAKVPKGILLHGPPGTGKTLLAKAVAHESRATFLSQSASSFVEMFAGLGAARIRKLFVLAKKEAPAIIFIDELDAVGTKRGFDMSRENDQTLNQLLVEMDGFGEAEDVVVIAASNRLDSLDPALLRPGRFDRQVFISPPDLNGRVQILKVHTADKPLRDVDLELVARQCSGLTGADLANICNEAAIVAGRARRESICAGDFSAALERVVAGLQTRKVITPDEKKVIAYHEAGHALVSELLESVDRVQKISIVPRGRALGYTLNLPEEDRYLKSKEELLDYLKMLFGGRVAEEVVFGRVTTGAADDLRKLAEISRSMIEEYGMGSQLIVNNNGPGGGSLSETTRGVRDSDQQGLLDKAQWDARCLIVDHRELLDELAESLLADESLERPEIERITASAREALERKASEGTGSDSSASTLAPPNSGNGSPDGPAFELEVRRRTISLDANSDDPASGAEEQEITARKMETPHSPHGRDGNA